MRRLRRGIRGAALIEYVILLISGVLLSAGAWKAFAPKTRTSATRTAGQM